jgi:glycosyltransferase involved in cell wall biosynthesis
VIGISLLTLVPGASGAGIERYARDLCRGLGRWGSHASVALLPSIAPDAAGGIPGRVIAAYPASRSLAGRAVAMASAVSWPDRVLRQMLAGGVEALHYPLTIMVPPVTRVPTAVTIADVQHEVHPEFFSRTERLYRRWMYARSAEATRIVVTLSDFSAHSLVSRLGLPAAKIRVIPPGVDAERFRPGTAPREAFLLYPANFWPHKNHARLFAAFARVRVSRPDLTLVLTGAGHGGLRLPQGVVSRGLVSDDELVRLYQTASATVFPSVWEGFGLPAVEAMACGCPVVASRAASLPEVCGDAARYVDPLSPEDIAIGIEDVLRNPAGLIEAGLRRAARFTLEACVRAHDAVYGELVA